MNTEERNIRTSRIIGILLVAALVSALIFFASSAKDTGVEVEDGVEAQSLCEPVARLEALGDWEVLQLALAFTESRFNPSAVGKAHDSGILQITPIYVAEVNRVAGTGYTLQDAFDIDKSLEIFETMQAVKNPSKDIETAIYYHNKAGYYRRTVLANMEFVRRYEAVRAAIVDNHRNTETYGRDNH